MNLNKLFVKSTYSDSIFFSVFLPNLIMIILAIIQHWNLLVVMWIYWLQSIIIGCFNVLNILLSKNWENSLGFFFKKIFAAIYFIVQYGIIHIIFAFGLGLLPMIMGMKKEDGFLEAINYELGYILIPVLSFIVSGFIQFFQAKAFKNPSISLKQLIYYPYPRIVPFFFIFIIAVVAKIILDMIFNINPMTFLLITFILLKIVVELGIDEY